MAQSSSWPLGVIIIVMKEAPYNIQNLTKPEFPLNQASLSALLQTRHRKEVQAAGKVWKDPGSLEAFHRVLDTTRPTIDGI